MPIIDEGVQTCEKCGRKFEWKYFEFLRQNITQRDFVVEEMPDSKLLVHNRIIGDDKITYAMNCPHCDYDNIFEVTKVNP